MVLLLLRLRGGMQRERRVRGKGLVGCCRFASGMEMGRMGVEGHEWEYGPFNGAGVGGYQTTYTLSTSINA